MRAQIRELTRPVTLLAAVLVYVSPSPAAGLPRNFVGHSNQEDQQNAHSNQETTVGLGALLAGGPPVPAELESTVTQSRAASAEIPGCRRGSAERTS